MRGIESSQIYELLKQISVGAIYILLGSVIHSYFTNNGIVSVFWPASGLALGVILIGGKRYLWGISLGALIVNALANNSIVGILGTTIASVLEVMIGTWLLTRKNSKSATLLTLPDYLRLISLGGGVASLIAASIGSLSLLFAGFITSSQFLVSAIHWWMGDTLGIVIITPLILAFSQIKNLQINYRLLLERLLLICLTYLVGQIIFFDWFRIYLGNAPRGYWMFLCIAMIAIRIGVRGTTFTILMIAFQALLGAYYKIGFFAHDIEDANLANYWFYMIIISLVGMALATHVNGIQKALEDLQLKDSALNAAANGIVITNLQGQIEWANQAFSQLTGYSLKESYTHKPKDLIKSGNQNDTYYKSMWDTILANKVWHGELVNRRKDGTTYDEEMTITPLTNEHGEITHFVAVKQNITERKKVEAELQIAATVFESQEGMMITDADGKILKVNQAFTRITGYTSSEVVGQTPNIIASGRHDKAFYAALWEKIFETGAWQGEIWNKRKNGEIFPQWLTITAVKNNQEKAITCYVATLTDITDRKATEEYINRLAFYDPLTELPNRRLLEERLKHGIASNHRTDNQMAVLMLDLDKFKAVNDTFGHSAGDELLQQVAKRIKARLREADMVSRLGGDEFIILIEDLHRVEHVTRIAEDIIHPLGQPFTLLQKQDVFIGASIGISIHPKDGDSVSALMDNADAAMYRAKDRGRGCLAYFSKEFEENLH